MTSSPLLMIFAKEPVAGKVKTRLAQSIGPSPAARVYELMLQHVLSTLQGPGFERVLYKTPDSGTDYFERAFPDTRLADQSPGDLGLKMAQAFAQEFSRGFQRICIIGTDCPSITLADLNAVFAGLDQHDVVLGPATDGGYFLMGLRAPQAALFTNIVWSGPDVLSQTHERIKQAGLSLLELPGKHDIDDEGDLREFLSQSPDSALTSRLREIISGEHTKDLPNPGNTHQDHR